MAQTDSHSSAPQLLSSSATGQTLDPFWTRKQQSRVGGAMRKREEWLPSRLSSAQHTSSSASEIDTLLSRREPLLPPTPHPLPHPSFHQADVTESSAATKPPTHGCRHSRFTASAMVISSSSTHSTPRMTDAALYRRTFPVSAVGLPAGGISSTLKHHHQHHRQQQLQQQQQPPPRKNKGKSRDLPSPSPPSSATHNLGSDESLAPLWCLPSPS